jgi:uncharacterized protein involved in type VI secretion and phage assembly
MLTQTLFDIPAGLAGAGYLAEVVSVADPDNLSRVQVRLLSFDGVGDHDGPIWARVAVPFAGGDRGAFMLPDVGDEVLITFVNGDVRFPIVIGGLWNGNAGAPESLGGAGDRIDRWTIVGKAGTRIAIVEENDGEATISFKTPGGVIGELTDKTGGKIEFKAAGTTITIDKNGVSVQTPAKVKVEASQIDVKSGEIKVEAIMTTIKGIVICDTLQATTIIGTTYTPGAGNVW